MYCRASCRSSCSPSATHEWPFACQNRSALTKLRSSFDAARFDRCRIQRARSKGVARCQRTASSTSPAESAAATLRARDLPRKRLSVVTLALTLRSGSCDSSPWSTSHFVNAFAATTRPCNVRPALPFSLHGEELVQTVAAMSLAFFESRRAANFADERSGA